MVFSPLVFPLGGATVGKKDMATIVPEVPAGGMSVSLLSAVVV